MSTKTLQLPADVRRLIKLHLDLPHAINVCRRKGRRLVLSPEAWAHYTARERRFMIAFAGAHHVPVYVLKTGEQA